MKHPALTRVFAFALAVFCLVMLLAGAFGIVSALKDNRADRQDYDRLRARIDEYNAVCRALDGGISYEQAKAELDERQEQHDEDASQHRIDLAEYTATRGGLTQGTAALDQADAAMKSGWDQYYAGLEEFEKQAAAFDEGYRQFLLGKQQLEDGWKQYNTMAGLIGSAAYQLESLKNIGDIIESDDENARVELSLAAFDGALAAYDQAEGLVGSLIAQGTVTEEQIQQITDAIISATGMTPEQIRQQAQTARDNIAAGDETLVLTDEQFAAVKEIYNSNRDSIAAAIEVVEAKLYEYQSMMEETRAQLESAQAEMDKMDAFMEEGKKGIEQGRLALEQVKEQLEQGSDALYSGRTQIWYQLGELEKKAEKLRQEKQELDEEADELGSMSLTANERRALEQRQTSVRLMLLARDGIKERADGGMGLADAALKYAEQLEADFMQSFHGRLAAYMIMVLGAVSGFIGIPAAFEKSKSRFMLAAPPVFCFACALTAEIICLCLGRGSTYSAIGVIIFAAMQMLVVLPGKEKAKV